MRSELVGVGGTVSVRLGEIGAALPHPLKGAPRTAGVEGGLDLVLLVERFEERTIAAQTRLIVELLSRELATRQAEIEGPYGIATWIDRSNLPSSTLPRQSSRGDLRRLWFPDRGA